MNRPTPHPAGPVVRTDLLLVGAGHAHLHVLRHAASLRALGVHVLLVAPRDFRYSGLLSPVAAGLLPDRANHLDVATLAARCGVDHLDTTVVAGDPSDRVVHTADGRRIDYRIVSYNLGSVTRTAGLTVGATGSAPDATVLSTKPVTSLLTLRGHLAAAPAGTRFTIVGDGPTGVELAACISARRPDVEVHLVGRNPAPAPTFPLAARQRIHRRLRERGIVRHPATRVTAIDDDGVHVRDLDGTDAHHGPSGRVLPADVVLLATGLEAPAVVAALGLGDEGGIPVTATLQHPDHPEVFAVGDCSRFLPRPLPRLGVYGVRAAPVLLQGLRTLLADDARPMPRFEPQRRSLQVLELGHGQGLAVRGRWWSEGRGALRLKRTIDRTWLARSRRGPWRPAPTDDRRAA
ncbi:MAG: FAD-dependent oxidoreductase [Nitriliruptoraceae bacterium]|nr:FAD-dependent oxidoreductase [Nitriliruptoraceae bacterium]